MNLSSRMADWLRLHGIEAARWHELGQPNDSDEHILEWCRQHQACLVSQDADFAKILRESGCRQPSVIYLRDCNPIALETWRRVLALLRSESVQLAAGSLFVMNPRHVRSRSLPIHPGLMEG